MVQVSKMSQQTFGLWSGFKVRIVRTAAERPVGSLNLDRVRLCSLFTYPFLFLVGLDPLKSLAINSWLELENIEKALIFALGICLQAP